MATGSLSPEAMQGKLAAYRRLTACGFSLVEMLVVLAIVSLLAGLATLVLGRADSNASLDNEIARLRAVSELASTHAILTGNPVALHVQSPQAEQEFWSVSWHEYKNASWVDARSELPVAQFPAATSIRIFVEGNELIPGETPFNEGAGEIAMIFYPTGEITPFEIHFRRPASEQIMRVGTNASGRIALSGAP